MSLVRFLQMILHCIDPKKSAQTQWLEEAAMVLFDFPTAVKNAIMMMCNRSDR